MTGTALYLSLSWSIRPLISSSGTSSPGQPYHWKVVVFESPLKPLTRTPEDMDMSYLPSSERLMVMGRRFETSSRRPSEASGVTSLVGSVDIAAVFAQVVDARVVGVVEGNQGAELLAPKIYLRCLLSGQVSSRRMQRRGPDESSRAHEGKVGVLIAVPG